MPFGVIETYDCITIPLNLSAASMQQSSNEWPLFIKSHIISRPTAPIYSPPQQGTIVEATPSHHSIQSFWNPRRELLNMRSLPLPLSHSPYLYPLPSSSSSLQLTSCPSATFSLVISFLPNTVHLILLIHLVLHHEHVLLQPFCTVYLQ